MDHDMKRRPLDGNARSLEPDTELSENIVNEALIARVVRQPVHNVAVRMRGDGIDFWRRVHRLLPSSDLVDGTGYVVSPLDELKAGIEKTGSSFEFAMLSPLLGSAAPGR